MPDGGGDPSEDHVEHVDPDMQAIHDLVGPSGGAGEVLDEAPPEAPDEAEDEAEGATVSFCWFVLFVFSNVVCMCFFMLLVCVRLVTCWNDCCS